MTGKTVLVGAAIGLVSAGIAAGGIYSWQSGKIDDLEDQLRSASKASEEAGEETDMLREVVVDLEARLGKLRGRRDAALKATRLEQDCVARVSGEDKAGPQAVILAYLSLSDDSQEDELLVDVAEWYVGEDANREALEDGEIEPGDSVPNDYYIRNDDPAQISMQVADDIVVVTTTADRHNIPTPKCKEWRAWIAAVRDPQPWQESIIRSPYWLTVQDDAVVRAAEQYLP